jgi:hypothetical protein
MNSFKWLDIFRKLPKDLTEPTFCGALGNLKIIDLLVSIACTVMITFLGFSEIKNYVSCETSSNIVISTSHTKDTFKVNLDITFPKMPCDVIGLNL